MKRNMKKIVTLLMILTLAITATVVLSGCGGPTTLEEYINSSTEAQEELDSLETQLGDGGSVTVKENNVAIVYKYASTFDADMVEQMKPQLESAMESMDSTFQNLVTQLEDESGLDGVSLNIEYQNGDGSIIYSKEYK